MSSSAWDIWLSQPCHKLGSAFSPMLTALAPSGLITNSAYKLLYLCPLLILSFPWLITDVDSCRVIRNPFAARMPMETDSFTDQVCCNLAIWWEPLWFRLSCTLARFLIGLYHYCWPNSSRIIRCWGSHEMWHRSPVATCVHVVDYRGILRSSNPLRIGFLRNEVSTTSIWLSTGESSELDCPQFCSDRRPLSFLFIDQ